MSLDPTSMGSKLSNSQIIVVAIEAQCRRTKIRRLSGRVIFWDGGGGGMGSVMRHQGKILLQPNARVHPHSNSISSMTSMILLFMSLDPTIKGSNLSNSKIIDVVDEIEVECGRALIDVRCLNISAAGMSSFMWVHVQL